MGIDISQIDQGSIMGQIILLLIVLPIFIREVRGVINLPAKKEAKKARIVVDELETAKKELQYTREVYKSLVDWQLTARELIRLLRYSLADLGGEETAKIKSLLNRLEEIEDDKKPQTLE